jgi:hypothetical protein
MGRLAEIQRKVLEVRIERATAGMRRGAVANRLANDGSRGHGLHPGQCRLVV